jgi:bifunctional non-homologous end joining protein LigD
VKLPVANCPSRVKSVKARHNTRNSIAAEPESISNPEKVFWPDEGFTKFDLARFYQDIFPVLQPYVADRLLICERCPDGMSGQCFYQREKPNGLPAGTPTRRIRHENGYTTYVLGGQLRTQLAMVNLGCIAVHIWSSRATTPHEPDWVCFDLDPSSGEFADAANAGMQMKEGLDHLGLVSFPKTSGNRGVHVLVPIQVGPTNDEVSSFARDVAMRIADAHPDQLTVDPRLDTRKGRVYIDTLRNGFAQSVVSPYSVRRKPKAPVSTPLEWSEVTPSLIPSNFNISNFRSRLKRSNAWRHFFDTRQSLRAAVAALRKL